MTRTEFTEALDLLEKQSGIDENFRVHMQQAFPSACAPVYENVLWDCAINLLEAGVGDSLGYISWWVFETSFGKEEATVFWEEDGRTVVMDLSDAGLLYDFLTREAEASREEGDYSSLLAYASNSAEKFNFLCDSQTDKGVDY